MNIKQRYQQFRQWQLTPFNYVKSHEQHHCHNCDLEFEGHFCPTCGQKATAGPITWKSIHRGILEVWGMGSRSLPYTLLQLLGRPGYFMSDYINGRRQVSFPPVKMLVLVGLAIYLLDQWLHLDVFSADGMLGLTEEDSDSPFYRVFLWLSQHYEWGMLFFFIVMALPTHVVFRDSPRNTRHTLPQEFFIQVFNATHFLILLTLTGIIMKILDIPTNEGMFETFVLLPTMLFFNYKQLFGYSYRGTLWRICVCMLLWLMIVVLIVFSPDILRQALTGTSNRSYLLPSAILIIFGMGILHAVDILNNWKVEELHRGRFWRIFNMVFIVTAASIFILIVTILSFALFGGLTGKTLKKILDIKPALFIILVVCAITLYILIKGMKKVKKNTAVALDSEQTADDMSVDEAND